MSFLRYIVIVGAVSNAIGTAFYARDIIKGTTRPNKVSFLMWSMAPLIGGFASLARGATWATVPAFAAGLLPLGVLMLAIWTPRAYWKLSAWDYVCGLFSFLALLLWLITNEPNVAIVFAIVSDAFATFPTLRKAWRHPETELGWTYFVASFSGLTGVFAIQNFNFAQVAFPLYLFISMGLIGIAASRKSVGLNHVG